MKIITSLLFLILLGADLTTPARSRFDRINDSDQIPYEIFLNKYKTLDEQSLEKLPLEEITEDNLAKYWRRIGLNVFRMKSGNQAMVLETGTDASRIDTYIFWQNKISDDISNLIFWADEASVCAGDHERCIFMPDPKIFIGKMISYAMILDNKYFTTAKKLKLGMKYEQVEKIYGKPDKTEIYPCDKSKMKAIWQSFGTYGDSGEDIVVEGPQLEEAKKAKKEILIEYSATLDFVDGKLEQIHFHYYYPG